MKYLTSHLPHVSLIFLTTLISTSMVIPRAQGEIQPRAEAARETPSCNFEEDLAILKTLTAKLSTAISKEERALLFVEELDIRKRILGEVIACALKSTRALHETLRVLQVLDGEGKDVQKHFVDDLNEAIGHYERMSESIRELDSEGMKLAASSLRVWREETYLPLAERAGHFVLWAKNQELLDRAQTRISQTRQMILSLKLAQNEEVQNAFERANTFLLRSEEAHRRAQQSLTRKELPAASLEHIKSSLGELYRLYETLFELNETIPRVFLK